MFALKEWISKNARDTNSLTIYEQGKEDGYKKALKEVLAFINDDDYFMPATDVEKHIREVLLKQ